jgi:hypothetical protein
MSPLPDYVEYGGRATAPPPFLSREGTFRGHLLVADSKKIADLVDRVYNVPADGKVVYQPMFGGWVLMQAGAFRKVSSQAKGFQIWGYVNEAQISVWIPVAAGRLEDGQFIAERVGMAVPYILVNNPMSYAGGREIYGYPKTLGIFDPPCAVGDPQKVEAFGGDFSANSEANWRPLFELSRTGAAQQPGGAEPPWQQIEEVLEQMPGAWAQIAGGLPDVGVLESILKALVGEETLQVFLKQFRDVADPGQDPPQACCRHVVEAPIRFLKTAVRPSFEEWNVVVHHLDSHPIEGELGLCTQTTRLGFDGTMDFIAEPGTIVAP